MNSANTFHAAEEFGRLPWDRLDPERFGKDWFVSRGGYGMREDTWAIKILSDGVGMVVGFEVLVDIWELPAPLCAAINTIRDYAAVSGKREVRDTITQALGL